MNSPQLAIASGTALAADAGAEIAAAGGNAVDAAIASTFVSWVCEPGLTSLGSGGYCTVWPHDGEPVTIDGFVEMPGRSADRSRFGHAKRVTLSYGGGVDTIIGSGSIATPGALAALDMAWKKWGRLPWREIVQPAIQIAKNGFPLSAPSHLYFNFGAETVLAETFGARQHYLRDDGSKRQLGETMTIDDLDDTLEIIASEGADALYRGDLGHRIADWIIEHGGLLGRNDLEQYRAEIRPCLMMTADRWHLATNPPPAVGGAVIIELAMMMNHSRSSQTKPNAVWPSHDVAQFAHAMETAFTNRLRLLGEDDLQTAVEEMLGARVRDCKRVLTSPSTSHTSAVDRDGMACSITTSTGYSSGVVVPGTGILLNNMLGELELNPRGLHAQKPGERLRSNMAPSVARSADGEVLSFGAAGAERIASSLVQVWINVTHFGMNIREAINHARCHLEWRENKPTLAHEPGVDVSGSPFAVRAFDSPHMFFGGVQAAMRSANGELSAAGDPRRGGGAAVR